MARSIAARLARLPGTPASRSHARPGRAGARRPAAPRGLIGSLTRLPRMTLASVLARRRVRIALLLCLLALPALAGGWLLLRDSPLVSVERVELSGVHGPDAAAIEAALSTAARRMSTLEVNRGALLAAVAPFHLVRAVQASPSLPHALRIRVIEQLPVAALDVGGTRTAVAADGVVLGPALLTPSLPELAGDYAPPTGARLGTPGMLAPLAVLGAAPAPLAAEVARVYSGDYGITAAMRDGLLVYFGDAGLPHAKWLSLARVLADPSSAGASYIDVRLPERPAAGFPAGVTPPAASSGEASAAAAPSEPPSTTEGTIAALAAALTGAGGGSTAASGEAAAGNGATSPGGEAAAPGATGAGPSSGAGESAPGAAPATGSAPGGEASSSPTQPGG